MIKISTSILATSNRIESIQKLNNTTLEEKQKRCETLRNSQHIAIIELPDSILKLSHSYTNDLLQVTCIKGERFSSVRDTAIVKTSLKK